MAECHLSYHDPQDIQDGTESSCRGGGEFGKSPTHNMQMPESFNKSVDQEEMGKFTCWPSL